MTKHPDERKIRRYQKEDPKFDAVKYRKAFHRAGRIIEQGKNRRRKDG